MGFFFQNGLRESVALSIEGMPPCASAAAPPPPPSAARVAKSPCQRGGAPLGGLGAAGLPGAGPAFGAEGGAAARNFSNNSSTWGDPSTTSASSSRAFDRG